MTRLGHIACVDDDSDILSITEIALSAIGNFQVSLLHGPHRALDKMAGLAPDLVLLDVMMPEIDGPAVLREMMQKPSLAKIPVVFMTARVQKSEVEHYRALGAIGVIAKPFDPMTLAKEIQHIWDQRADIA